MILDYRHLSTCYYSHWWPLIQLSKRREQLFITF